MTSPVSLPKSAQRPFDMLKAADDIELCFETIASAITYGAEKLAQKQAMLDSADAKKHELTAGSTPRNQM